MLSVIDHVVGAVDRRSTMQILSHVKVDFLRRGAAVITASDLEVFSSSECEVELGEYDGKAVCVPGVPLRDALKAMSVDEVGVIINDDRSKIEINGGGTGYEFVCLPAAEFLNMPEPEGDDVITFAPRQLPRQLQAVRHAAAGPDGRPNLAAVHLVAEGKQLTAVATDGHRMSIAAISGMPGFNIAKAAIDRMSVTLSTKACGLIASLVGTIEFTKLDNNSVHFLAPGTAVSAAILQGGYPDFRSVIPTDHPNMINVDRQALIDALEACGAVADSRGQSVTLQDKGGMLSVAAIGQVGVVNVSLPMQGDPGLDIIVSARYLVQALKALDGGEVFLKFNDSLSPLLLYPSDYGSWDERFELIVPIRKGTK